MAEKEQIRFLQPLNYLKSYTKVGTRIGMLTILGVVRREKYGKLYRAKCDCGKVADFWGQSLARMRWPSCGCQTYPVCQRNHGRFVQSGSGSRPLGPKLLHYRRYEQQHSMRSHDVQVKAQISRCVGRIVNNLPMFKTGKGTILAEARTVVRSYSKWHIKEFVRVHGLQKTVDTLYEKYENLRLC